MDNKIVAGAVFDFAAFLTTRKDVIHSGSSCNAAPMVVALKEWADLRKLPIDNPRVLDWNEDAYINGGG